LLKIGAVRTKFALSNILPTSNDPDSLETLRQSFTREAQASKTGQYDQIPQLLAHFEDNLEFYLVQEFIPGHPLSAELAGQRWSESQMINCCKKSWASWNLFTATG